MRTSYTIVQSILSVALLLALFYLPAPAQRLDVARGFDRPNMELYGNDIMRHIVTGDNLVRKARWEDAVRSYDYAIAHNPYFADAYMKRAIAKWRMGRESEAEQDYQMAIRLNPYVDDLYGYKGSSGRLQLLAFDATRWIQQAELQDLIARYDSYLQPRPRKVNDPAASEAVRSERQALGRVLEFLEGEQLMEARELLNELEEPIQLAALLDLKGLLLADRGQYPEALAMHLQAIQQDDEFVPAYYNQSRVLAQMGRMNEALEAVDEAIALDPAFHLGYLHRAHLLKITGRPDAALADYDRLYKLGYLNETGLLLNRAVTRKLAGDVLGALNDLDQVIERQDRPAAGLLKLRGNLFLLLGEPLNAVEDYTAAIRRDPNLAEAYFNRGLAYLLANVRSNGCYDIKQSVELGYEAGIPVMQYFCGL